MRYEISDLKEDTLNLYNLFQGIHFGNHGVHVMHFVAEVCRTEHEAVITEINSQKMLIFAKLKDLRML